jgi:hypothetical protein
MEVLGLAKFTNRASELTSSGSMKGFGGFVDSGPNVTFGAVDAVAAIASAAVLVELLAEVLVELFPRVFIMRLVQICAI